MTCHTVRKLDMWLWHYQPPLSYRPPSSAAIFDAACPKFLHTRRCTKERACIEACATLKTVFFFFNAQKLLFLKYRLYNFLLACCLQVSSGRWTVPAAWRGGCRSMHTIWITITCPCNACFSVLSWGCLAWLSSFISSSPCHLVASFSTFSNMIILKSKKIRLNINSDSAD